jgi:predicted DNA-binding ribbon-helix-helix protein
MWCNVVSPFEGESLIMAKQRGAGADKKKRSQGAGSIRTSISFPPDTYESLEEIAKQKKVSLAWVVREATEQYITDKWPLFKGPR